MSNSNKAVVRIQKLVQSLRITVEEFEKKCGIDGHVLKNAIDQDLFLNEDTLTKIFKTFPSLNHKWILLGKGSMMKGLSSINYKQAIEHCIQKRTDMIQLVQALKDKDKSLLDNQLFDLYIVSKTKDEVIKELKLHLKKRLSSKTSF